MQTFLNPARKDWPGLCARACADENDALKATVASIIERVRRDGDAALRTLSQETDGRLPASDQAIEAHLEEAATAHSPALQQDSA